jgi:protein-L-isoaspartate(D-aspartate) O-methyltransferase
MQVNVARFNMREARFNMIEQQIRTWDVLDPTVLQLLNDVPRERFVPAEYQGLAFADIEIPLGYDSNGALQTMLSPKLEGRILQALNVQKHQNILHIGTGSGYFTALLASLAKHVTSIEIDADLSAQAAKNLAKNNISNVTLMVADGILGQPNQQFDVIVYTGSSPREPAGVREQLSIGGVLFIVLGNAPAMQATLIQRVSETGFRDDVLFETCLPALLNAPQIKRFEF